MKCKEKIIVKGDSVTVQKNGKVVSVSTNLVDIDTFKGLIKILPRPVRKYAEKTGSKHRGRNVYRGGGGFLRKACYAHGLHSKGRLGWRFEGLTER